MSVARILKQKGSSEVAMIRGSETLQAAARELSNRGIGALIVSDDGESVGGIISERDIIRMLGREGTACMTRPVADAMTREVETCAPDEVVAEIMKRMTGGRFRHMPVMEEGRLVGVISIGDVVKYRMSELEFETEALSDMIKGY